MSLAAPVTASAAAPPPSQAPPPELVAADDESPGPAWMALVGALGALVAGLTVTVIVLLRRARSTTGRR